MEVRHHTAEVATINQKMYFDIDAPVISHHWVR